MLHRERLLHLRRLPDGHDASLLPDGKLLRPDL
jgi:hypothetical protein